MSNSISHDNKKFGLIEFFLLLVSINFFLLLIALVYNPKRFWAGILFGDTNDTFMDFFNYLKDLYTVGIDGYYGGLYPPIMRLIFKVFISCFPESLMQNSSYVIRGSQIGLVFYFLIVFIFIMIFSYTVFRILKNCNKRTLFLVITFLLSAPMIFAIERGNTVIAGMTFLIVFFALYDSPQRYKRNIACFALALAAVIKIYPAVCGIVLIINRRYKSAILCVILGLLLFFVPFVFTGGMQSAVEMVNTILHWNQTISHGIGSGEKFKYIISLRSSFSMIHILVPVIPKISQIIIYLLATVSLLLGMLFKKDWKIAMLASLICVIVPSMNCIYSAIFLFPSFVLFFKEENQINFYNVVITLLIFGTISVIPFGKNIAITQIVSMVSMDILFFILFFESFVCFMKFIRRRIFNSTCVCL